MDIDKAYLEAELANIRQQRVNAEQMVANGQRLVMQAQGAELMVSALLQRLANEVATGEEPKAAPAPRKRKAKQET